MDTVAVAAAEKQIKRLLVQFCEKTFTTNANVRILGSIHIIVDDCNMLNVILNEKQQSLQIRNDIEIQNVHDMKQLTQTNAAAPPRLLTPHTPESTLNLINYIHQLQQLKASQSSLPGYSSTYKVKRKRSSAATLTLPFTPTDDDSAIASANPSTNTSSGDDDEEELDDQLYIDEETKSDENGVSKKKKICQETEATTSQPLSTLTSTLNTPLEFICNICPKSFKYYCYYKRHMEACHSEAPKYVCEKCNKSYKWEASFRQHLRSRHGIISDENTNASPRPSKQHSMSDVSSLMLQNVIAAVASNMKGIVAKSEPQLFSNGSQEDDEEFDNDEDTLNEENIDCIQEQIEQLQS